MADGPEDRAANARRHSCASPGRPLMASFSQLQLQPQEVPPGCSLPEELILSILRAMTRCFPAALATTTLASCSLVSKQWYRLASPILHRSPMIDVGSERRASSFLNRLAGDILQHGLEVMSSDGRDGDRPVPLGQGSLIGQMKRLMFFGEKQWRHRGSVGSRPAVTDRATLHAILNRLWATRIQSLVLVELPFTAPFHQPIVNRYPSTLTTLVLLTPLSHFELLLMLRNLPTLAHLCIGSNDDTSTIPAEHHTLFSRDQLPSSNLRSFGIAARSFETWLKTGIPWHENMLNLIVLPSVRSITTLHIELADEDDERHLLSMLGCPHSNQLAATAAPPPAGESSSAVGKLFKLENVFLRGFSSVLMAESLSRLEGVRKLCLSSPFAMALRCPNPPPSSSARPTLPESERSRLVLDETIRLIESPDAPVSIPGYITQRDGSLRKLSTKNIVWQSIPSTVVELSIEITRLANHGPWTKRSSDKLTLTLTSLIRSGQCPNLRKLGTLLAETSFQFGIYGPHCTEPPVADLLHTATTHGVALVPSFWSGESSSSGHK